MGAVLCYYVSDGGGHSMQSREPIAHVSDDGRLHPLREHLEGTARLAAEFASEFGAAGWGRLAGLWHDLGKYSPDFQKKIYAAAEGADAHIEAKARVDHSTAGAIHAIEQFNIPGRILAYLSAGHHAGLSDWQADNTGRKALSQRTMQRGLLEDALGGEIPADVIRQRSPEEKPKTGSDPAFWVRMLFSCLVDADFLDTEAFFNKVRTDERKGYPSLNHLLTLFNTFMTAKQQAAASTPVNRLRSEILKQCVNKAAYSSGIFSFTVPTGGGKTLSSMAFALNHAKHHSKRRIIYVIPYTSIIEQTSDQFRMIFGDAVVEHHSNIDMSDEEKESPRSRLACENWDAPIIVTTSVQFFESLFDSRTSRCRKLHNIVNSVVVLDEAQLLPSEYLKPILSVLQELQKNYGVSLVFSTATQPALGKRDGFEGLTGVVEIVEDPHALHSAFKRVNVIVPADLQEVLPWKKVADRLMEYESVLCIVNRRDDARQLWNFMPKDTQHLSALMCGAHRSAKIREIKERLANGESVRVISTQLVEAGVDLDFPVVFRALAGLDSIAQAAGRCNREGLRDEGKVFVFVPEKEPPVGLLRQTTEVGKQLLAQRLDCLHPDCFLDYFRQLYWLQGERLDTYKIMQDLESDPQLRFAYRTAAAKFHLIDERKQAPVIVRYGEGDVLAGLLEKVGPDRWLMRKLQRYVVNLPRYLHQKLLASGAIRQYRMDIFVQVYPSMYDDDLGFCADREALYEPDDLIV